MYGLDLFSGIAGITRALEPWVKPVAYCEYDKYAQGVLLSRMADGSIPVAPIWDDVSTLHGSMLPPVDIIYGGFPCQDLSVAGRGAGLAGERSGLFFEIVRLVSEIRPRFVFLENVPAIRTRGASTVVKELARRGYDCRWDVISAKEVGAPHLRKRWFLLAYAKSEQGGRILQPRIQPDPEIGCENVAYAGCEHGGEGAEKRGHVCGVSENRQTRDKPERSGENVADTESLHDGYMDNGKSAIFRPATASNEGSGESLRVGGWWSVEPSVGRVANGVPLRVDRLKGLGNAVVPAQAREAFKRLMGIKEAA